MVILDGMKCAGIAMKTKFVRIYLVKSIHVVKDIPENVDISENIIDVDSNPVNWHERRRCSRSPVDWHRRSGHYFRCYFLFFFFFFFHFFFSVATFSHRRSAWVRKPIMLGLDPFADPVGHFGASGDYFGLCR